MFKKVKKITKKSFFKTNQKEFQYTVGNFKIWLPNGHRLPEYQSKFMNYDKNLINIIENIKKFDKRDIIIDIGANVGDTAALFRTYCDSKIICIEGNQFFLNFLTKNAAIIPRITIVGTYVNGEEGSIRGEVERTHTSSKIITNNDLDFKEKYIETKTLKQILSENGIHENQIKLLKIDTDGYDFNIILGNQKYIMQNHPNLYFEYDLSLGRNTLNNSFEVVSFLESAGYILFLYDNFGNLMDHITTDFNNRFILLNHYLTDSKGKGGSICHYDIFATTNNLIANALINDILNVTKH